MVTITVNDSSVINALRGAKSRVIPNIKIGLELGGGVISNEAKTIVPVLTGTLKRSIHPESVEVKPGSYSLLIGSNLEYAEHIEFGGSRKAPSGYMRPALDEKGNEAINEIKESLMKLL